jgi:hypothetical protein
MKQYELRIMQAASIQKQARRAPGNYYFKPGLGNPQAGKGKDLTIRRVFLAPRAFLRDT